MKKIIITLTAVVMTIASFGQTGEIVKCRIWQTKSFCKLPDSINLSTGVTYNRASMIGAYCNDLDSISGLVGVWVTFQGKNTTELKLTNHYKNISIISQTSNDTIHPYAYMERDDSYGNHGPQFLYSASDFDECIFSLEPKKKYDLFIIFKKAKAGDRFIIDKFLETEIK